MTDKHPIDDPELDAVPADAEDEEEAGLYEHYAVTADKGQTPMRLDKFLTVRMEHCSRNRIQAAADSGNILVNGKAAKSSYKVKPLDRIQIVMPYPRREIELLAEDIPLEIPYEDKWLLLVDKPAGLVVHPGVGNYSGTLVNALMFHLNKQGIPAEEQNRAGLVHRIDKNTSGLLVIAKDEQTPGWPSSSSTTRSNAATWPSCGAISTRTKARSRATSAAAPRTGKRCSFSPTDPTANTP